LPVTKDDLENVFDLSIVNPNPVMVLAAAGLTPISPVTWVVPVVEIPDFARTTKLPAVPRFTAAGPAALASGTGAKTPVNMDISKDSATSVAKSLLMCSSPLVPPTTRMMAARVGISPQDFGMTGTCK
jgi:hypothetical protein